MWSLKYCISIIESNIRVHKYIMSLDYPETCYVKYFSINKQIVAPGILNAKPALLFKGRRRNALFQIKVFYFSSFNTLTTC